MKIANNFININPINFQGEKVNLIVYNGSSYSKFKSPHKDRVTKFQEYLISNNISTFIRKRLGVDIDGACGQLAASYKGNIGV